MLPLRPAPERPAQAGSSSQSSEKPRQSPLAQSADDDFEATQLHPEEPMQPGGKFKQAERPAAEEPMQGDSKGKQPERKTVYGYPQVFIARIPVKKDGDIRRVKVYIEPDTAFRHPQTFFFKNIPCVDPYWGYLNDKASTAIRIVRLRREAERTPYFLLVCRGEYPQATSPRNENAIFHGLHEPIFGDAFVFKLGDPELYGDAYARYVDIEEDLSSISRFPGMIRDAAKKVEDARPINANPGLPDVKDYADPETIKKDKERLNYWGRLLRRASVKYASDVPVDGNSGMPDLEKMQQVFATMVEDVDTWKERGFLAMGGMARSILIDLFAQKLKYALETIQDNAAEVNAARNVVESSSVSTNLESSDVKTTDAVEKVKKAFQLLRGAYRNLNHVRQGTDPSSLIDTHDLDLVDPCEVETPQEKLDVMALQAIRWVDDRSLDRKKANEFVTKMEVTLQTINHARQKSDVDGALSEIIDAFYTIKAEIDDQKPSIKKAAKNGDAGWKDDAVIFFVNSKNLDV